jgi:hypothetical protein
MHNETLSYVPWIYIFLDSMQVFISPTRTSIITLIFVWIYIDASCRIPWLYVHTSKNLLLAVILSTFNQKSGVKKLTSVTTSYPLDSHVTHCVERSIWWIYDGFPNPYCPYAKEYEYNEELCSFVCEIYEGGKFCLSYVENDRLPSIQGRWLFVVYRSSWDRAPKILIQY